MKRTPWLALLASTVSPGWLGAASIAGTVLDSSGAALPGVILQLRTPGEAVVRTAAADGAGEFQFSDVAPGTYTVHVQAKEFATRDWPLRVTEGPQQSLRIVLTDIAPVFSKITVTAARGAVEEADTAPQVVASPTRDVLQTRTLQTTAHALDGSPGILIQETTFGQSSPILRGLTGYQTLLLVDGIRFNTSIDRSGPNQYFSFVQPSQVERIEAVLGPAGATFGSDSMGGTINVLTLQPNRGTEISRRSWHYDLNGYSSSADRAAGWDSHFSSLAGNLYYLLGGGTQHDNNLRTGAAEDSHNAFRRYFGLDPGQVRGLLGDTLPDTASSRAGAELKLSWQLAPSQTVTGWYQHSGLTGVRSYRDRLGGPGRLVSNLDPQGVNFGYLRYEKLSLGPLDSLSGTFSVNSQQDGTVQQAFKFTDPITHNESRVDALGFSVQAAAHLGSRHLLVMGSDTYRETVWATRFTYDPVAHLSTQVRAQYPDGSHYTTSSLFLQDAAEFVPHRLRVTAGLRLTMVRFAASAGSNRDATGALLGVVDSKRSFSDLTFNTSASWQMTGNVEWHVVAGRGFRAPNLNDLGAIGLTTLGYDVPAEEIVPLDGMFGLDSSDGSAPSGKYVASLTPESLFNYESGLTVRIGSLYLRAQAFDAELSNPISGRTVLFPVSSVPTSIAGVPVTPLPQSSAQQQQSVVAVATSQSPRAVMAEINDGHTRYYGTELLARLSLARRWTVEANYGFLVGRDLNPNRPVRRLPPQQGTLTLRYVPSRKHLWLEAEARAAGAQERLNGGDTGDDRIGASRRRSDIATFFGGGFVNPYLLAGPDGRPGTADDVFAPTGETLLQIQNRVLPLGATINGITVLNNSTRVPLFPRAGGWLALDVRGGVPLDERWSLAFALTNVLDHNYRVYGSGVDAPGISAFLGVKFSF